jgi:hypothetical protein
MSTLYRGEADDAGMAARPFVAELHRFDAGQQVIALQTELHRPRNQSLMPQRHRRNIAKREEC